MDRMSKYLYGACGNEGCLDCTPTFVVDGGEEQYEAKITIEGTFGLGENDG